MLSSSLVTLAISGGDYLILIAAAIDIIVTVYLLISYLQHRGITRAEG